MTSAGAPSAATPASTLRQRAWLIPVITYLATAEIAHALLDSGLHLKYVSVLCFYLGLAAGWLWQRLHRCDRARLRSRCRKERASVP